MAFQNLEGDLCCVCLESLEKPGLGRQSLECGHVLHEQCVKQMRCSSTTAGCPICKKVQAELFPVKTLKNVAIDFYMKEEFAASAKCASLALQAEPEDADMNTLLGELLIKGDGSAPPSGATLDRAIELLRKGCAKEHALAFRSLGAAYMIKGNVCLAERFYKQAILRGDAQAMGGLSLIYAAGGHAKAAKDLLDQSGCECSPKFMKVHELLIDEAQHATPSKPRAADSCIGMRVFLDGLESSAGQRLNRRIGTVIKFDKGKDRFGIDIDGVGVRSIKRDNIFPVDMPERLQAVENQLFQSHEDQLSQPANQCAGQLDVTAANARVSETLLKKQGACVGHVILLKFARNPKAFLEALMSCEGLAECRANLETHGKQVILPSRAKAFLHPHHYDAVLESVEDQGLTLYADHVLVESDLEDIVISALEGIVKPKQDHRKEINFKVDEVVGEDIGKDASPRQSKEYDEAAEYVPSSPNCPWRDVVQMRWADNIVVQVQRTFIHYKVPNSLCTLSSMTLAKTA